jgi:serum/glucocorticoid-regulated kinase 2
MYRDMKPENILVGKDGYLKLADFGLAKIAEESNTFCGTPEYISPEILLGTGHDHTADWWALGVLIYEMLTGIPPFYDKNRNLMFLNIERAQVKWPSMERHGISVSDEAKDLILKLLTKDKNKRLGVNGGEEVLAHPFFASIAMDDLIKKRIKAPFIPQTHDPDKMRRSA